MQACHHGPAAAAYRKALAHWGVRAARQVVAADRADRRSGAGRTTMAAPPEHGGGKCVQAGKGGGGREAGGSRGAPACLCGGGHTWQRMRGSCTPWPPPPRHAPCPCSPPPFLLHIRLPQHLASHTPSCTANGKHGLFVSSTFDGGNGEVRVCLSALQSAAPSYSPRAAASSSADKCLWPGSSSSSAVPPSHVRSCWPFPRPIASRWPSGPTPSASQTAGNTCSELLCSAFAWMSPDHAEAPYLCVQLF